MAFNDFIAKTVYQDSPMQPLIDMLSNEEIATASKQYEKMRFVGYVLEIGFESATIITSDPYKQAVGGVPRGSFLIMTPNSLSNVPPHFTLLRVADTAPTPLAKEVQQTYFELHKKSMPELDIWTQGELQWGALKTSILGMFYPKQDTSTSGYSIAFSGDVNNVVSAHRYNVFSPDENLLNLIINSIVKDTGKFELGKLRFTECQLPFENKPQPNIPVFVSTLDFRGFRTAMFGKTRLGKSNVVKLIAQSLIETTQKTKNVGQLIFDVNGEYANDNPQDGNTSLRSAYNSRCEVYSLYSRTETPSKPLKLNFYTQPDTCIGIIKSLLEKDNKLGSNYIGSFAAISLPSLEDLDKATQGKDTRLKRKILFYWAILHKAGFTSDEVILKQVKIAGKSMNFDPKFNKTLRKEMYGNDTQPAPNSLASLYDELNNINDLRVSKKNDLKSSSGGPLFDADDESMLNFLFPTSGSGPTVLRPYKIFHDINAGDFVTEILQLLDNGQTVILDLGNALEEMRRYFSDLLSKAIFSHQEKKFTSNNLNDFFIQLYFEEAHNLFPKDNNDFAGIYARFAKEGAKFHIGIVYSTQSPSTINKELLAQTENFFVGHMSSQDEVNILAKLQVAFDGLQQDILKTRTPGYMRMMTFSHRFIVPMQANKFELTTKMRK